MFLEGQLPPEKVFGCLGHRLSLGLLGLGFSTVLGVLGTALVLERLKS